MLESVPKSLLSSLNIILSTSSQIDQHRREKLILLRPLEREPSTRTIDVGAESTVGAELDLAHVSLGLLHTNEVVDVDVGALDVLRIARSARALLSDVSERLCYLLALVGAGAYLYVKVSAQLLESCETVVGNVSRVEVGDDVFDCGIVLRGGLLVLPRHVCERDRRDCGGRWMGRSYCADIYANETNRCGREWMEEDLAFNDYRSERVCKLQTLQQSAIPMLHKLRTRQTGPPARVIAHKTP